MSLRRLLPWLLAVLASLLSLPVAADTALTLNQSFAGNVNFTGIGRTMRTSDWDTCAVNTSKKGLTKTLSTVPANATVRSARLYWAGSGSTIDTQVTFEGQAISADRKFTSGTDGLSYFGAVADVTSIVKAKSKNGNGTYSFSGLTVDTSYAYCSVTGVLAGFALLVVYDNPGETFRVLNIYEGFQFFHNSKLDISLSNFKVPSPLGSGTGRIGHITWEGDWDLNQDGENLMFQSYVMTDGYNPKGNQFNSVSNIDGDSYSYGVDFDAYTLTSQLTPGMTQATTSYSSGQDLVLLTAEIIALPNIPTADLGVTLTRVGEPLPNQDVTYTVSVKNNGPSAGPASVTVKVSLPQGMNLRSAGAGSTVWSCLQSSGTTSDVATCTYNGSLANGTTAPPLVVVGYVIVPQSQYVTTAAITATSDDVFDNNQGNNSASDTATDTTLVGATYAFTDRRCTAGYAIGTTGSGCARVSGTLVAGTGKTVYITVLDKTTGYPKNATATSASLQIGLSCVDPVQHAGISANFGAASLGTCQGNGAENKSAAATVTVPFATNAPSSTSAYTLLYRDVGKVNLLLFDSTASTAQARAAFTFIPNMLDVQASRIADGVNNPGGAKGFVPAGADFTLTVTAREAGGAAAPNFGRETAPPVLQLSVTPQHAPYNGVLTLSSAGRAATGAGGVYKGTAAFSDAGDIQVVADVKDLTTYLNGGMAIPNRPATLIGRFYPAYFATVATSNFDCLPHMSCPTGATANGDVLAVPGAVYSGQPLNVAVSALNAQGVKLANYSAAIGHAITLKACSLPGAGCVLVPSATGSLSNDTVSPGSAAWPNLAPTFSFAKSFSNTAPNQKTDWMAPLAVYLRASATIDVAGGTSVTVTSLRPAGTPSEEDGVMVISGRVQVGNATGSELLRLPMRLDAQYWSGSAWENNINDDASQIMLGSAAGKTVFSGCKGSLLSAGTCAAWLNVAASTITLSNGQGRLRLDAPGAGRVGSVDVNVSGNNPAWLPSTKGRATFGVYKSRLIYIREIY